MRGSVKLVQVKGPATDWESMNNVWGASWELAQSPPPPLDIRIQDDQGGEVRCCPWGNPTHEVTGGGVMWGTMLHPALYMCPGSCAHGVRACETPSARTRRQCRILHSLPSRHTSK